MEWRFDTLSAAAGTAYLMELEQLGAGLYPDSGDERLRHRLSTYVTMAVQAAERVKLGQTLYVQPRLDDFSDVRVLQETAFLVSAGKVLAIKLSLSLVYDAHPPAGVLPLDGVRKASLQLNF